jgi:hypothetical protein
MIVVGHCSIITTTLIVILRMMTIIVGGRNPKNEHNRSREKQKGNTRPTTPFGATNLHLFYFDSSVGSEIRMKCWLPHSLDLAAMSML